MEATQSYNSKLINLHAGDMDSIDLTIVLIVFSGTIFQSLRSVCTLFREVCAENFKAFFPSLVWTLGTTNCKKSEEQRL